MTDRFLTTAEVSAITHLPAETLRYYRHLRNGKGPKSFVLGGRRVLYSEADVAAWIEAARAEAVAP